MSLPKSFTANAALASYTPTAGPTVGTATQAGAPGGTFYVALTAVTAAGESLASPQTTSSPTAGNTSSVTIPAPAGAITGYNVYVSTTNGVVGNKQNATPLTAGPFLVANALANNGAAPTVDNSGVQTLTIATAPASQGIVNAYIVITDLEIESNSSTFTQVSIVANGSTIKTEFVNNANPLKLHGQDVDIKINAGSTLQLSLPSGASSVSIAANADGFQDEL